MNHSPETTSHPPPLAGGIGRWALLSAFGALLLWGGWCYIANAEVTLAKRIGLSLAQGIASFLITLLLARGVAMGLSWLRYRPAGIIGVPLIAVSLTGSGLWILHNALGTPHIVRTIAPPSIVAFLFCLVTARRLIRRHRSATPTRQPDKLP